MGDHSVKRLKIESFTVYPDFSRKTTSTELFTGSDNNTNDHIPALNNNVADIHDINGPTTAGTSYQDRMLEQALQWENSREELLDAYFESMMPTPWSKCAECAQDIAQEEHVRCQDCGGHTFFCSIRCVQVTHNGNQLFLHKPKLWKVRNFS